MDPFQISGQLVPCFLSKRLHGRHGERWGAGGGGGGRETSPSPPLIHLWPSWHFSLREVGWTGVGWGVRAGEAGMGGRIEGGGWSRGGGQGRVGGVGGGGLWVG